MALLTTSSTWAAEGPSNGAKDRLERSPDKSAFDEEMFDGRDIFSPEAEDFCPASSKSCPVSSPSSRRTASFGSQDSPSSPQSWRRGSDPGIGRQTSEPVKLLSERRGVKKLNLNYLRRDPNSFTRIMSEGFQTRQSLSPCLGTSGGGAASSSEDVKPRFLMNYELLDVLGTGTMSVVKRARCREDNRFVAVKCICSTDEEVRQYSSEEYNLVRQLRHPAIIRFDTMYESSFNMWIVMELCSEGCVETYVTSHGPFLAERATNLFRQLLLGVNYLHRKRVVHRDIKPANLLLQKDAQVLKISDFNSAKKIGNVQGGSVMLTDRGTHLYRAPELRFGRVWNERIDIWACGLSLYFMVKSRVPFDNEDPTVAQAMASGRLPSADWTGITPHMRALLQQCLSVDVQDRPPAMELLLHPIFNDDGGCKGACSYRVLRPGSTADLIDLRGAPQNTKRPKDSICDYSLLPSCGLLATRRSRFVFVNRRHPRSHTCNKDRAPCAQSQADQRPSVAASRRCSPSPSGLCRFCIAARQVAWRLLDLIKLGARVCSLEICSAARRNRQANSSSQRSSCCGRLFPADCASLGSSENLLCREKSCGSGIPHRGSCCKSPMRSPSSNFSTPCMSFSAPAMYSCGASVPSLEDLPVCALDYGADHTRRRRSCPVGCDASARALLSDGHESDVFQDSNSDYCRGSDALRIVARRKCERMLKKPLSNCEHQRTTRRCHVLDDA